jgi:low affinity Fe/Cu permease
MPLGVTHKDAPVLMPSEVSTRVGIFDRFAGVSAKVVGRAAFFAFCVALVVIWAPTILLIRDVDTWQLIINTLTTIITFLMVALLQNSQTRSDQAIQHKLNAIADALADFMDYRADDARTEDELKRDVVELRDAVGLEQREGTSHNDNGSTHAPAQQR